MNRRRRERRHRFDHSRRSDHSRLPGYRGADAGGSRSIDLPSGLFDQPVDANWAEMIAAFRDDIQAFQDRWDIETIEQFVAADFAHVGNVIRHVAENVSRPIEVANRFLEWGCGFGLITTLAADLGLDAVGIDSQPELIRRGDQTRKRLGIAPESAGQFVVGNFLPASAESLADDPTHPSLGHDPIDAYQSIGLEIDDFGIIYSYPWPGENNFHRRVFERYACAGCVHIQFCGPNDVRAWQKN